MEIGQKLRELREGKRLSQVDIGKKAGLLQSYVSRVERGRPIPSVETLVWVSHGKWHVAAFADCEE
jgi:transcriptional regulator with XRE-family HTH domain